MRVRCLILLTLCLATSARAVEPQSRTYRKQTFGEHAIIRGGAIGSFNHLRNVPREWGKGGTGLAKRVSSSFATHAVRNTIAFAVAGVRHEDLRYHPSGKQGFGPRLGSALKATVVTRKTTTGKRTMASGKLAGNFGSGLISRAWQPARLRTVSSGVASGGIMLGADAMSNVVQEFWPEIRHPKRHHSHTRRSA